LAGTLPTFKGRVTLRGTGPIAVWTTHVADFKNQKGKLMISRTTFAICATFLLATAAIAAPPAPIPPPGDIQFLPAPAGAVSCEAWDISDVGITDIGTIVGVCDSIPALWNDGGSIELLNGDLMTTDSLGNPLQVPIVSGTATAINSSGQIAGVITTATETRAAFWQEGNWIALALPPGANRSIAQDIDDAGRVIGTASGRATIWTDGQGASLPMLATGNICTANASNESGAVVGQCNLQPGGIFVPVVWKRGTVYELLNPRTGTAPNYARTINESGLIGGTAATTAYLWNAKTPGKSTAVATGIINSINDKKIMVGFVGNQAAWWRSATQAPVLLFPSGSPSTAKSVNNFNVVVGYVDMGDGTTRAFVAR
jgi:uncharacterized membrane protein